MRAMSGEIEIGRSKRARQAYSFDDIAVVPARRTRDVRDVRVSWQLDAYHVDLPVMASPMDSVMSPETAILVGRLGGIGVLDLEGLWARYEDPADALDRIRTASCEEATRVLQEVYRAPVRPELITYLHRLSDAVYSLARLAETWRDEEIERIVRDAVATVLGSPSSPDGEPVGEQSASIPSRTRTPARRFDLAAAKRIAERAEARSVELGVPVVIAAADAGGNLMLLHRVEGALLASTEVAINKAWSAVAFQAPTATLGPLATEDGPFPGLADTNSGRVVLFGGGVPVHVDGELAGAIGISGGTAEQDVDIATCALQDWNTIGEQ